MSTKLLRRLLHHTAAFNSASGENDVSTVEKKSKSKRRRKPQEEQVSVGEDEVVSQQVQSLLFMDEMVARRDSKKDLTAKRIQNRHEQQKKDRKVGSRSVLGNSRSSSSTMVKAQIPTFNKKRYNQQKEAKRLAHIAKLLKQNSKKATKKK